MKRVLALIYSEIVLLPLSIDCLISENNLAYEILIFFLTLLGLIILGSIFPWTKKALKELSVDRVFSLLGLEIALIVFIQTDIQNKRNNKQFEENRIASDSLFKIQLKHAEGLNDSLIDRLNGIQNINTKQNLTAENQYLATKEQLKLSKQSLTDYIFETRANLIIRSISKEIIDTISPNKVRMIIKIELSNVGTRDAKDIEIRHFIIYKDGELGTDNIFRTNLISSTETTIALFYPIINLNEFSDFYYFNQIRYTDEKINKIFDKSYYYNYKESIKGYDFYFVKEDQKLFIKGIIDKELLKRNFSLTTD
jgi:hypothetical protein